MRGRRLAARCGAVFVVVLASLHPASAFAGGEHDALLYALVAPSGVGMDHGFGTGGGDPRFRLLWSYQLPWCLFVWRHGGCEDADPLMRHRIVLQGGLALGKQRDRSDGHTVDATFDTRIAYRYRVRHTTIVAPTVGLGSTFDYWPVFRPSLSPEVGLHLGPQNPADIALGASLTLQVDVFAAGAPPVRVMAVLGWTLL